MRIKVLFILCLLVASIYGTEIVSDTVVLPDIEVSVSRMAVPATKQQLQVSVLDRRLIEQAQVNTPKEVSSLVPNVYMPDYGSAMTSSIYIRGMGSRINEPVMGMVVDGVPLLDKHLYDPAEKITLYGENIIPTMGGNPFDLYVVNALSGTITANSLVFTNSYGQYAGCTYAGKITKIEEKQ